jgi:hypothetical protein
VAVFTFNALKRRYSNSPTIVEVGDSLLGVLLPLELDKDIAHQMVFSEVVFTFTDL